MIIPVKFDGVPGQGADPSLLTSDDSTVLFSVGLPAFVTAALLTCFDDTTKFGMADVYKVDITTGVRTFIYTINVNLVGTSTDPNVKNAEGVFVFKTTVGKPLKVYLMESVFAVGSRNVGSVPADGRQDVVDWITSGDNFHYGRTDAFPLAFETFTSKENDVLRRRQGFSDV
jgi:hypothetical protein